MRLPSYLVKNRCGIYYLRIRRNGKEQRKSLGTRDPAAAIAAAWQFGAKISAMSIRPDPTDPAYLAQLLASGGGRSWTLKINNDNAIEISTDGSQQDHQNARAALADVLAARALAAPQPQAAQVQNPCTLRQAVVDYLDERGKDWTRATLIDYSSTLFRLVVGLGETTPLHTVSKDQFVKWRAGWIDTLHPKTQEKACGCIKGFETWAIERNRMTGPFLVRQKLTRAVSTRLKAERGRDVRPLDPTDLDKVLGLTVIQNARRPDLFFLPLLGLYTGGRIGELAQIRLQDIEQTEDGLILNITGEAGSVKTSVSNRKIPLHPALTQPLTLYMKDVCRCWPDSERLFPHLTPDPRNGHANRPGQDFSRMWRAAGLDSGKSFHSLRHTFISCLAACRVDQDLARSYTGHSTGRDDVHDRVYNHSLPRLEEYRTMLAGLDFSHWPGWTPPVYTYSPGQFDSFFAVAQKRIVVQKVRMARAERTPKRKSTRG